MRRQARVFAVFLTAGISTAAIVAPAHAADARDDRIKSLEQRLDALITEIKILKSEQAAETADKAALSNQVQDLKRGQAAGFADAQKQKADDVKLAFANGRPSFASADGKSNLAIRALLQYDVAKFSQNGRSASGTDLSSGANFRRARIGVSGIILGDWSYSFLYDMGGSGAEGSKLSDAYIQYDGFAPFHLRTGAFVTPQGVEDMTGSGDLLFLERAAPADVSRGIAGSDGRKNILSIMAYGADYFSALTWSTSRAGDAAVFDTQQAAAGRLAYRAYQDANANLLLSAGGAYVFKIADTAASPAGTSAINFQAGPENAVDGTRLISTGAINARRAYTWGVETAGNWKNFYGQGGYFGYGIGRRASTLPNPNFGGWYVQGSWVMTGESRTYNTSTATFGSPKAASPLDFKSHGIGAWELTARYSVLDLDDRGGIAGSAPGNGGIRGGRQEGFTAGINWYPNAVLRFLINYQHLNIDRLAAATPFQNTGQKIDIIAGRAQLAF